MTSVIARSMRRLSLHAHDRSDFHGEIVRAVQRKEMKEAIKNFKTLKHIRHSCSVNDSAESFFLCLDAFRLIGIHGSDAISENRLPLIFLGLCPHDP